MKVWDSPGSLTYRFYKPSLSDRLSDVAIFQHDDSMTVFRDVCRILLKIESNLEAEIEHQTKSYDGLRKLYPFEIYQSNISCIEGFLIGLERVRRVDGFGAESPSRPNHYCVIGTYRYLLAAFPNYIFNFWTTAYKTRYVCVLGFLAYVPAGA